jgi:internalin A
MSSKSSTFLASSEGVNHLNAAKARLNLTVAGIAKRAGVSADTVSRLWHPERGKRVNRSSLAAIAAVLELQPEAIVPADEWQDDAAWAEAKRRIQEAMTTGATYLSLAGLQLSTVPAELGQLSHLTVLYLSQNQLSAVPAELGQLSNLTRLYLSQNQLSTVPAELGQLSHLTVLSLHQNQLSTVPAELGQLSHLTELYLYQNQLSAVPAELGQLSHLTRLYLYQNQLSTVPAELGQLSNLTELYLSQNQLSTVPAELGQLSHLTVLSLDQNQLSTVPAELGQLSNLTRLSLDQNQLSTVPAELGQLSHLTGLSLDQNQLSTVPAELGQLSNLTVLSLHQNQLSTVPAELGQLSHLTRLSLDQNQLSTVPAELGQLSHLTRLSLAQNQLSTVPAELGQLSHLKVLYLHQNQLSTVPAELGQLSHLTRLSLAQNQLSVVPECIRYFAKLERLDLSDNALTTLPEFLKQLPNLQQLFLHGNLQLDIPTEILGSTWEQVVLEGAASANPQDILNYYFRIQANRQPLNEAKLILVGFGNVGKTSLVNRLIHNSFDPDSQKTEGIQITQWDLHLHNTEAIKLHVWDFGGQEIMHSTHQFFLTERSLYLLVLNGRQGHEDTDAEYWLELIQSFGGNSPVIVVLNKIKEHPFDVNRSALKQKFPNICEFIATDCEAEMGVAQLQAVIERETDQLEHLRDPFPATWVEIKNRLTSMADNYISFEQYRDICQQDGESDRGAQDSLAVHLHSLGIALNYKDDTRLRDTHVLNPHWVTNGIYKLLNAHDVNSNKGELQVDKLTQMLDCTHYPPERHGFLLELMRKFELCFPFQDDDSRYLIPDLLDKQQADAAADFHPEECLNFRYEYPILPEGLLPRFIVRTHVLSPQQLRWRTGVILEFEGNHALVKADRQDRCVTINVSGPINGRNRLLAVIRSDFERIHSSFKFKPQEKVPVPQYPDVSVSYQELLAREEHKQTTFEVFTGNGLLTLNVRDLLNGVDLDDASRRKPATATRSQALRMFYSYAHKDEALRDELEVRLKLLQRQNLIQPWHDRRILPGTDWKHELDTKLERADIILLLVSPDFINSDYCYEIEMQRAMARHHANDALVLPILLRPVNWSELSFSQLQALPTGLKPVTQWTDPDNAWLDVERGIRDAITHRRDRSMRR